MMDGTGTLSIDDLNQALALLRQVWRRSGVIFVLGIGLSMAFFWISRRINPDGISIVGITSGELTFWGMMATLVVLLAQIYLTGRKIGRILQEPSLMSLTGFMYAPLVIAQKASPLGMKPGFFLRPLRPIKKRR
jgi:hypothetical protein